MTTGRINQVTFSSARANDSRATPRICSTLASTWTCAHKPQTRPKNGRLTPTAATAEEMRYLRLPLLEQASINRDMLKNFQLHMPQSVHISKEIF